MSDDTAVTQWSLPAASLVFDLFQPRGWVVMGILGPEGKPRVVELDRARLDALQSHVFAHGGTLEFQRLAQLVTLLQSLQESVGTLLWAHLTDATGCAGCGSHCGPSDWAMQRKCCPDCNCLGSSKAQPMQPETESPDAIG